MAQIQKGTTYSTGDQVTATNLNALADSAILLPGAITDQTAKTVPLAADTLLIHSAADTALRKSTLTQLFASPQPIGATTANTGAFTTITGSGSAIFGNSSAPSTSVAGIQINNPFSVGPSIFSQSSATTNRWIDFMGSSATLASFTNDSGVFSIQSGGGKANISSTGLAVTGSLIATASGDRAVEGVQTRTTGINYSGVFQSTGSGATINTGAYINASGGTTNYGVRIIGPTSGANSYAIYSDATAQSYFAGNVGIGVTPNYLLDVNGVSAFTTTGGDRMFLSSVAASDQYFLSQNYYNNNGTEGVSTSARGSWRNIMRNATTLEYGIDWRAPSAAAGTFTRLFTVTSAGNVGIGTSAPISKLHVANGALSISDETNPVGSLQFKRTDGWNPATIYQSYPGSYGGDLEFKLHPLDGVLATAPVTRVTFKGNGDVNIGSLGTGLVYSNSGVLTSTNPSDSRLKIDITDLSYGLSSILALRPVSYKWKLDTINQGTQYGFIAQEVQAVMPDLVKEFETTEDGEKVTRLGLEKEGIYAAMVKAIKELNANLVAQVAALSQRLAALESK